MYRIKNILFLVTFSFIFINLVLAQEFQPENIGRGAVAVLSEDGGVYISWRLLVSDPDSVGFNVYRGNEKINKEAITASTNILDSSGTVSDSYSVAAVIDGVEQDASDEVSVWDQNYLSIPLQIPEGGQTPDGVDYTYSPNDASVADLDGDGEYEIILKWDPSNAQDNSKSGYTGNVYLDGLEMDGTLLWRIDLGRNIRAGAHYTQFMVYDLDGDGSAEVACKTADATIDGIGTVIGDADADFRNSSGYILSGPEYLTIFDGTTGEALATSDYIPGRGIIATWGDSYGNRVDRFLGAVAYLDGEHPSVVMCRGYYRGSGDTKGRTVLAAWDYSEGQLTNRWTFNAERGGENSDYTGQGNHNLSVADIDGDGKDEIVYGSMAVDDDGSGLWNTGLGHGDALHVSDIDPNHDGLEIWGIHEHAQVGSALLDGKTGEIIWGTGVGDIGRGVSANLDDSQEGMECWGGTDGLRSAKNLRVGDAPSSSNFVVWWDGDLERELLDGAFIQKYNDGILLRADDCSSNNGSKSNPALQADLFGDWREEVIWRTSDNTSLRIYTTTTETPYRITTLMQDRQYRLAVAWQNVGYNQPPHPSFFVGKSMLIPENLRPPSVPLNLRGTSYNDTVSVEWDANIDSDLAGYILYRGTTSGSFKDSIDVGNVTSYQDTAVMYDTTYYYAVAAYDLDGNKSDYSESFTITPTLRPDSPTGLSYRFDSNSIMLIWDSQNFDNIKSIYISRSESEDMLNATVYTQEKTATTYIDDGLSAGKTYYYTLSVLDMNNVESFPTNVISITLGESFTFQAEDAKAIGTVFFDDNNLGFNGTGFANFDASNSGVEFTYMPGFGGGERAMIFRYALGNDARIGNLTINGNTNSLTMAGTGEWSTYIYDSVSVTLEPGFDNTISFETTGSDYGNLDEITIVSRSITAVDAEGQNNIPTEYQLSQNFPNPFNPSTVISYQLPTNSFVQLKIFDMLGKEVTTLVNKEQRAGSYNINFNASNLSTGIYIYSLVAGNFVDTKKMILLK